MNRRGEPPDLSASLMPLVLDVIATEHDERWTVVPPGGPEAPWITARPADRELPQQGWKIHVSAYLWSAESVARASLRVIEAHGTPCKLVASLGALRAMNTGDAGPGQVGKFLTIYPSTPGELRSLVLALSDATADFTGPAILTDRAVRGSQVVQYRFGSFGTEMMQTASGEVFSLLRSPTGACEADTRRPGDRTPAWAVDVLDDLRDPLPRPSGLDSTVIAVERLYRSARSVVSLVLDTSTLRIGAAKQYLAAPEETETAATERMRSERTALEAARTSGAPVPRVLHAVDGSTDCPDAWLVTEAPRGETIDHIVSRAFGQGEPIPLDAAVAIGIRVADAVRRLHAAGMTHNDLKSANVIVGPDEVCLIDFESAEEIGHLRRYMDVMTIGYTPPVERHAVATVDGDVYAVGALLYLLLTGAEPSRSPNPGRLLDRRVRRLRDDVAAPLASVVERCLDVDPPSLEDLIAQLDHLPSASSDARLTIAAPSHGELLEKVRRSMTAIVQHAESPPAGTGITWKSRHRLGKGRLLRDVNVGVAGVLIALAEGCAFVKDVGEDALERGGAWLAASAPFAGPARPGLYIGEMGVGIALLRAGLAVDDATLVDEGVARCRRTAAVPYGSPDVFQGTAGRVLGHLMVWEHTHDARDLRDALAAGDALLQSADRRSGRHRWAAPAGYDQLSGQAHLGYAHGSAGIADALLHLSLASQRERYFAAADDVLRDLVEVAMWSDDGTVRWPAVPGGEPRAPFWCHGAAGIGAAMLHADVIVGSDVYRYHALAAARSVARTARWSQASLCHGLAGSLVYLAEVDRRFADPDVRRGLDAMTALLTAFELPSGEYVTEAPHVVTPDLMVGYGGVLLALCKLAAPPRADPLRPCGTCDRDRGAGLVVGEWR